MINSHQLACTLPPKYLSIFSEKAAHSFRDKQEGNAALAFSVQSWIILLPVYELCVALWVLHHRVCSFLLHVRDYK